VSYVHTPTEDKTDDVKASFHKFPKYHMTNFLGDFNAEVGWEDIWE
jgi:hypothetical protein